MTLDQIANWAQIVEAVILSLSIVFIGAEARQTLQHSRTQFGHGLTDRLYDRYFAISRDPNFSQFLIKDWSNEELQGEEYFRALNLLGADLIDLFDTYDAWKEGLVGRVHVDMRMQLIKLGAFLSPVGKRLGTYGKSPEMKSSANGSKPRSTELAPKLLTATGFSPKSGPLLSALAF